MRSQWYENKKYAVELRQQGMSITHIERLLNIPKSTLSGWFKDIKLSEKDKNILLRNQQVGLKKARFAAALKQVKLKEDRLSLAERQAKESLALINSGENAILDLALAMLYMGEGKKSGQTSISSSNPLLLRFVISVMRHNYAIKPENIKAELHLRADQNPISVKTYWSKTLGIPKANINRIYFDKRTVGAKTYADYKGVCVLNCSNIAIQRKLISLYNQFCHQTINQVLGD